MKTSIIIPSYQGAGRIVAILSALEKQISKNFEVIIILDGSTDGSAEIIRSQKFSVAFQLVEQTNKGRGGARNSGAEKSGGDLLIFYDDDMLPEPDSVEKHLAFHEQHELAILVGNAPQSVRDQSDFGRYRAAMGMKWVADYPESPSPMSQKNLFMTAANCSMKKEVFDVLGGFTESLTDAEDKEFGIRAFNKGIPLFFDKTNVAFHDEKVSCRAYVRRLRQYALANKVVEKMHPGFTSQPQRIVTPFRRIMYRVLAHRFWVYAVDQSRFLMLLPVTRRHQIYAAITYALSEIYPEVNI